VVKTQRRAGYWIRRGCWFRYIPRHDEEATRRFSFVTIARKSRMGEGGVSPKRQGDEIVRYRVFCGFSHSLEGVWGSQGRIFGGEFTVAKKKKKKKGKKKKE